VACDAPPPETLTALRSAKIILLKAAESYFIMGGGIGLYNQRHQLKAGSIPAQLTSLPKRSNM
jgi:hypothetical protein